ncbi:MAG: epoxyqueuosine reductase [Clostridia bacterium]|nr:epoxyqueuosine reductase [Clostridia bacterium]
MLMYGKNTCPQVAGIFAWYKVSIFSIHKRPVGEEGLKIKNRSLTASLKQFAYTLGIDLVGIAGADRFEKAPVGHRPEDLLPNAKAVVVVAIKQPEAMFFTTKPSIYTRSVFSIAARLDQHVTLDLARFLEQKGSNSLPIPTRNPFMEENMGDFSHKHAAVLAGLGEMGVNTLPITPHYGNRVWLSSVVTEALLVPDSPLTEKLCKIVEYAREPGLLEL